MKLLFRSIIILLLITIIINKKVYSYGPKDSLIIGKPMPAIVIKNINYFFSRQVSSTKLKGKWLVLDFWTRGCSSCVERFPIMNELNTKYHEKLQVILIGKPGYDIEKMYEKFRKKEVLSLPISYDSTLFNKFRIRIVPYVIVVDPTGIVRAITIKLSMKDFETFLKEGEPVLQSALNIDQEKALDKEFDPNKPLFVDNNGGPDTAFLFRSVLGRWIKSMTTMGSDFPPVSENRMQVTGQSIADFYMMAYGDTLTRIPFRTQNSYGKFWPHPEILVSDTSKFNPDFLTGKNVYCYSQSAPKGKMTRADIQDRMRRDLQNYFGFQVDIEEQKRPCWNLELTGDSLLNLGPPREQYVKDENDLYEGPLETLPASIWYHNQEKELIYDETGLDKKLWLRLDIIMSDISEINKGLKNYGIELRKSEHVVKVIVISDARQ